MRELRTTDNEAGRAPSAKAPSTVPVADYEGRVATHDASSVLALQRGWGNRATAQLLRQPQPGAGGSAGAGAAASRRRLVFIMGRDRRGFYYFAERYWRVHEPDATFITSARSLVDVIDWINTNVTDPLGRVYIVSHANEDGTVSFGVDSQDQDHHMHFAELNEALHPPDGSPSALPRLRNQIDEHTIVDIKGCDIGRSPGMLDLFDEAFGGRGVVYAPTHEQVYGYDARIADEARRQMESLIRSDAERNNPEPPPVDPTLRGAERTAAQRERAQLMAARARAIQAEIRARRDEVTAEMEQQGVYEALSGPEVQQPGTAAIGRAEVRREVDRLYVHLSDAQRTRLTEELVRAQRVQAIRPMTYTLGRPTTVAHVNRFWRQTLADNHFRVRELVSVNRSNQGGRVVVTVEVRGRFQEPGEPVRDGRMTLTSETPDDAAIIAEGRGRVANPERYSWDLVEAAGGDGTILRTARGQRMRGYLHHRSLDAGPTAHFRIVSGHPEFFGSSSFRAPAPATP